MVSSFLNIVEGYDFIEWPLVDGKGNDYEGNCTPNKDSYHLCVRTDDCASLFDRSLAAVYFSPFLDLPLILPLKAKFASSL